MSKVFIEESTLSAIGDAIRTKTGRSELIAPLNMPTEIQGIQTGGGDLPEEAFVISGDCSYRFAFNGWNWFIEEYGNKITTKDISSAVSMFHVSSEINKIPFDINFKDDGCAVNGIFLACRGLTNIAPIDFKQTKYFNCASLFERCSNLSKIGSLSNMYPESVQNIFMDCQRLRQLPEFINLNLSRIRTYVYASSNNMFSGCNSLRNIPEEFLKQFYGIWTAQYYAHISNCFYSCYVLDEVRGLNPQTGTITANIFGNSTNGTFANCHRLKNIIFATQDDGTPYSVNWKNQTIDLSYYIGYEYNLSNHVRIVGFNSGITMDKQVTDDVTYQALKDDPDWFTTDYNYSRYNHDSAVATINSLPDTSAYLASAGGTNTIKFKGAAGSATDGGAINTLTEEEIAVATARGWTVVYA